MIDSTETPQSQYHRAVAAAASGMAVFPVEVVRNPDGSTSKRPLVKWSTEATTDPAAIADWWLAAWPSAAIGVHCGKSGLLVCDGDAGPGHNDTLTAMRAAELPTTWTHPSSGGYGEHRVYAAPAGEWRKHEDPGFEVKAGTNLIVWPDAAPIPTSRDAFAPAPAHLLKARTAETVAITDHDVAQWVNGNPGPISGHMRRMLDALPPVGDARWMENNLYELASPLVTAAQWETGGALARDEFIAMYAASGTEWDTPAHRKQAARNFDRAAADRGMPFSFAQSIAQPTVAEATYPAPTLEPEADAEPAAPAPFRMVTIDELRSRPRPEWIIEGLLQESGVIVLAGTGGIGKSFLALDWSCRITTGDAWFGRAVKPGKVLYVAAEGVEFFADRLTAWEQHNALDVSKDRLLFVEEGFSLSEEVTVEHMKTLVAENDFSLVVLDTLSQLSDMESENDNAQVARVLRQARAIRQARPGTSVLVVHHVSKGERSSVRGASAIRDNADTVLVAKPTDGDTFMLSSQVSNGGKMKNAADVYLPGFFLRESGPASVIDREDSADPAREAIDAVLADGDEHAIGDVLAALGDTSNAMRQRVKTRLATLASRGDILKRGERAGTRYRLLLEDLATAA